MRTHTTILAVLVGCLAVPFTGVASRAEAAPAGCVAPTAEALSGFFDGHVPGLLDRFHVPGAVVSVVSGDATVFARGYGLADREHGVAFDPDRSLVRIASITKLFTWTAVMQQVQAGRLDLNADVNRYLTSFQVPATYAQPVTLMSLMNHTSGFEDRIIGTGARTPGEVTPLDRFLATNMPARIRPAGQISAYSNYGAALAGYIVAKVSGLSYEDYVRQNILEPLAMTRSTATEPVPAALADGLARSYNSDDEPLRLVPFEFDQLLPDGGISATAADMAHFMRAQVNGGRFGEANILSPAVMAEMHQRSFAADPRLSGYAHGFMDRMMNGHRVLMHDGGWEGFQSVLLLVPGCKLGLFLSLNATGGADVLRELMPGFLDRFLPVMETPDPTPTPVATAPGAGSAPRAGFYQPTRHNQSTVEKIVTLLGPYRLAVDPDGTVRFKGKTWTTNGDGLYRSADGGDHLVFLRGADGRQYVATDGPAYQLMSASDTITVNIVIVLGFALIAISALVVLVTGLVRRALRRPRSTTARWRLARLLAAGAAVIGLVFLAGLFLVLTGDTGDYLYGAPVGFRALLGLFVVALLTAAGALVLTAYGWRGSGAGLAARIHQLVLFTGLAALTWFGWQWNLIGWQF